MNRYNPYTEILNRKRGLYYVGTKTEMSHWERDISIENDRSLAPKELTIVDYFQLSSYMNLWSYKQ